VTPQACAAAGRPSTATAAKATIRDVKARIVGTYMPRRRLSSGSIDTAATLNQ
jgi:hypothetical protein